MLITSITEKNFKGTIVNGVKDAVKYAINPFAPFVHAGREVTRLGQTFIEASRAVKQTIDSNRPENEAGKDDPVVIAAREIQDLKARFEFIRQREGWTPADIARKARGAQRRQQVFFLLACVFFFVTLGFAFMAAGQGQVAQGVMWLLMASVGTGLFAVHAVKWAKLRAAFETRRFMRWREFSNLPDFWARIFMPF